MQRARQLMTRGLAVSLAMALTAVAPLAAAPQVAAVQAPGAPVLLEQMKVLNSDAAPMVLLYAAVNQTDKAIDQFTVTVFVFDKDKRLKARQVAPGRRTLNGRETKFSAMVLDVGAIDPGDSLVAGVDQAQQVDADDWWRADLRTLAENMMKPPAAPADAPGGRRR